ncbi:hypothetical protein FHS14_003464 [Paenibacillus baekrokdamisoli]|nr:hypothetical protein [Paenibacillus baekrokdamisoli]
MNSKRMQKATMILSIASLIISLAALTILIVKW